MGKKFCENNSKLSDSENVWENNAGIIGCLQAKQTEFLETKLVVNKCRYM